LQSGEDFLVDFIIHFGEYESKNIVDFRVWNKKLSSDEITLPSGKKYTLVSIPYYLISNLEGILSGYTFNHHVEP